jgi:hypothetical protein
MFRRANRIIWVAVALPVLAATAFAATFSGNGTVVGTNRADTIKLGAENDTAYGLLGKDTIKAGNGNDMLDGDGQCPPGVNPGVYPNGLPSGEYCEHGPIKGDPGDTIKAGNGNDTIYGGGGPNTIKVGGGTDTVFGGPGKNKITAGDGPDTIEAGGGPDTIRVGKGAGTIFAQNAQVDHIRCAQGNHYVVYADPNDVVSHCATVVRSAPRAIIRRDGLRPRTRLG